MLDPEDWDAFRSQSHRMLDDMVDYLQEIRTRPVWQPADESVQQRFLSPLPANGSSLDALHTEFMQYILPYAVGNAHPGFMGWVHGGGTPVGMVAEMLAAGLNANLGGRNQIPVVVERQVIGWMRDLFGLPDQATGVLTTGTSAATVIALTVARNKAQVDDLQRLVAYVSSEVHGCIGRALGLIGFEPDCLCQIPCNDDDQMDVSALRTQIATDLDAGLIPWLIVGSAGTVNTGAMDDLAAISVLAREAGAWFHVDGALGAMAMLAADIAPRLHGIAAADSLALDFHKWAQVPYDAGLVLIRDGDAHRDSFTAAHAYLHREDEGLAANSPWPCDYGVDLSRGFRALKVWFTLKAYGTDQMGAMISHACQLARTLGQQVERTPQLELMAAVSLNIVCFRYCGDQTREPEYYDAINRAIITHIQLSGMAAPSLTRLHGRVVIRAAIVNHRTEQQDIDRLLAATLAAVQTLKTCAAKAAPPKHTK